MKTFQVTVLARRAGMSPGHFNRAFKSVFGGTPAQFVENLRLNEARRRLSSPGKIVASVAELVGFSNTGEFRRAFEKRFGANPRRCLKNINARSMVASSNGEPTIPAQHSLPIYLSADASLRRPSRICAGVQAAKPKTYAGLSFASIQKNDSIVGLIPIWPPTRATLAKSASRRSHATRCSPVSGTSRMKRSLRNLLNSAMKNSLRSA
jgi:AraC-like DNA-binding protein